MARVTHIKPKNMLKKGGLFEKAHAHLLRHYKELKIPHQPCEVQQAWHKMRRLHPARGEEKHARRTGRLSLLSAKPTLKQKFQAPFFQPLWNKHGQKPEEEAEASPFEDSWLDLEVGKHAAQVLCAF
jgi:hypothetical protein